MKKADQERFDAIWKLAKATAEYEVIDRHGFVQEHHNAWGDIYVRLKGDFGKWLRKETGSNLRKEIKVHIPHSDFNFMFTYARTFQQVLEEYGIDSRDDIEFN